jgi:hypothetical protein
VESIAQEEREWNSVSRLQQTIFPEGEVQKVRLPARCRSPLCVFTL